eukprot:TRINITY_DN9264_c0_g1_i1.p1 TRINITY_DN9264_c0_g1~~TRINITY_DN9264_c0_g1_i1.p1  ORF type:complete len:274 (+),score=100.99 TRINITY_DN9264_c0_g1_i1:35-856(+)
MVGPAAFPVAKLGFLLVKQVSKPLAKSVAARAKKSPFFKNWVCIPVAQLFHFYEVKMKMRALNLGTGKVTKVPKLTEAKAVEQGSEILSEAIIISIASAILVYEYNRSKEKEDAKEEKLKADRESIKNKIFELELKVEKQSTQIRNLAKTAIHLEEEIHKKSLKRFFGKPVDVPLELIKTVEEIPEFPKEIKPLELLEDKKEEEPEETQKKTPVDSGPTIKEIVEQHYAKPVLIEHNDVPSESIANADVKEEESELSNKPGVITDSVSYVMKQ